MLRLLARPHPFLGIVLGLFVLAVTGCDSSETDTPDIAGSWSGAASLPAGFTVSMNLDQRGRSISGTADLPNRRNTIIVGEINDSDRFVWDVQVGCERWSGSLAIDEAAEEMSGSINLDGGGCAPATSASGTMTLSR